MRKVLIVAASLVVVLSGIGLAPAASAATQDITFTNATTSNGLGTSSVNGVYAVGSTIYAATYGGLSISTDGGATFTNYTTDNGLGDNYMLGVYAEGSTIYAATAGGLSISTNGGATFTNKTINDGLGTSYVNGVYAQGSTVYAATYGGGLSISTDGGTTFTNYTIANGLGDNYMYGVYAQGGTIYAATGSGLSFYVAPPASSPIPMWQQAIGRASASAPCPDGYTGSWDTWPNSGTGGFVCNRFIPAYGN